MAGPEETNTSETILYLMNIFTNFIIDKMSDDQIDIRMIYLSDLLLIKANASHPIWNLVNASIASAPSMSTPPSLSSMMRDHDICQKSFFLKIDA